jgi:Ca2+/Na+ antiporter
MDKVEFFQYVPSGKSRVGRDLVAFTILFFCLAFMWLNDGFLNWAFIRWVLYAIIIVSIITYSYLCFHSLNEKEVLKGDFVGYLIFRPEKIFANREEFELEEIVKLEFYADDFDGKFTGSSRSIEPKLSNGVNNRITVHLRNRAKKDFYFLQNYEGEFLKKMKELLIAYHLKDKISFLALIQYIGISDSYEEIQEFKKELALRRAQIS